MRSKIRVILAATALAVPLILAGCEGSSNSGDKPTTFRWAHSTSPATLDPAKATADGYIVYLYPIYDTLVQATPDGELTAGLATKWTLSPDGKTLDLVLREGVEFQDGTAMDAEAVKTNLDRYRGKDSLIANDLAAVDRVVAVSSNEVRLHLNSPGGGLPSVLAGYAGMMASPEAIANGDLATKPVGAGAFKLSKATDANVTYRSWKGYWNASDIEFDNLKILGISDDTARLNALRSGQVDAALIRPSQSKEAKTAGLGLTQGPRIIHYGIILNTGRSELDKPDVRKALMHAIDRSSINSAVLDNGCSPQIQPFPKGFWGHIADFDEAAAGEFDPAAAKDLLAQAGVSSGFKLQLLVPNITVFKQLGDIVQAQLKNVGVQASVKVVETTQLYEQQGSGDFDALMINIRPATPDVQNYIEDYFGTNGSNNPGGTTYPGVDNLVSQLGSSTDSSKRAVPLHEAISRVYEAGAPVIPICSPATVVAHASGVEGITTPVLGNFDFRGVTLP